jgi:hypothetical protein
MSQFDFNIVHDPKQRIVDELSYFCATLYEDMYSVERVRRGKMRNGGIIRNKKKEKKRKKNNELSSYNGRNG